MQTIVSNLHGYIMFAYVFVFNITAGIIGSVGSGASADPIWRRGSRLRSYMHSGSCVAQ